MYTCVVINQFTSFDELRTALSSLTVTLVSNYGVEVHMWGYPVINFQ